MDGGTLQSLLTVPATDIGGQWIAGLVPDGSPLAAALSIFGSILSAIAAASLGYYLFAGTVSTAHEGKVLGAKWHQIWAPVRVIVGLSMLVPIGGGLGGGERAVLELARMGNGLASTVWLTFVAAVAQDGGTLPPPQSIAGGQIARMVWESETCVAVVNKLLPQGNDGMAATTAATLPTLPSASPGDGDAVWDYGGACGRISLPVPTDDPDGAAWAKVRAASISSMIAEMRVSGTLAQVAVAAVQGALDGTAAQWPTGMAAYLDALGKRYDTAALKASSTYIASRDRERRSKLVDNARAQGWLSAGEMWTTLRDLSQAVAAESNRLPDRQPVRLQELGRQNGLGDLVAAAKAAYGKVQGELAAQVQSEAESRITADDLASQGDANADMLQRLLAPLTRPLAAWALSSDPTSDPVGGLISLGHNILAGVESSVVAGAGVAALTGNGVAALAGGSSVFSWLAQPVMWAVAVLLVCGAVLAYILPILQFIFLFWHAVAWYVSVLESLIAVPIWALMWVRLDGAELADNPQKQGILQLFNAFLRPSLGVLALIGSYYIIPPTISFLRTHFGTAFLGNQGGHVVGVVGIVVGILLLTYLSYKATVRILELVAGMADRIGRWYGVPPEKLGEGEATTQVLAASMQAGQRLEHAGPRLPKSGGGDGGGGDGAGGGSVAGGRGGGGSIQRAGD